MIGAEKNNQLVDSFGRTINYIRMSATDRCDFRCVYCMAEDMSFIPREKLLTLEEMAFLGRAFVELGVKRIRLTGGEPLVRKNVLSLFRRLGNLSGLDELLLTTNGSRLQAYSSELASAGVSRINISLDSLNPDRFRAITRHGDLNRVLRGIDAAQDAGIGRVKINAVIIRGQNDGEVIDLINFARGKRIDISFIEEMPLGHVGERNRRESMVTSAEVREIIRTEHDLVASATKSAGPSRYYRMLDSDIRVGFISPNSHNFCGHCNRVRITCEGRMLLCLGEEHSIDLRAVMRHHPGDMGILKKTIQDGISIKPERHHFYDKNRPQIVRFMNATGG